MVMIVIDKTSPSVGYSDRTSDFINTPMMQGLKKDNVEAFTYLASMHNANATIADILLPFRDLYMEALSASGELKVGENSGK